MGSRWGGGGGGGRGGVGKIGGADVPWEYDPDLKIETKPSELFPPKPPPIAPPPRRPERSAVARYRALRERIHEGPLYTVLGDTARVSKSRPGATAVVDPFEGMPTYSQKYKKQRRKIPRLDTRPYILKFFPAELWTTLDPTLKDGGGNAGGALKRKRKTLQIAKSNRLSRLEELEEDGDLDRDDDDDDGDLDKDDPDAQQEEQDDDFEEDESDLDDYNAENYFDNGEDDDFGDEGGGGGGDGYDEW
ncbi:uncharacterized protein K452DRAFT_356370 [Aplosporella prunicola CBS 121167]|uniref:DNA-directed RNA polymerase III subunit n=1 Tax=Aplosporella prunicola CBS 121167 TaxID=1176127 RepID=A0A6A6BP42_9PEZI|nr:uncharacterized protein K452DRAFT_356370 [Aplosporella prunicola CBS 121167]KAF2145035.1 hypothetical protein K452DRAFT_356370 [Aplosporella prunicola CBS 121167]